MTIGMLNERIANAKNKIEKKQNTIAKKEALIEKKAKLIGKDRWAESDIEWLKDDIKRLHREIEETEKTLAKYEAQLAGEIEKEYILVKEIPESMKQMQTELVERWDGWDKSYRETLSAKYHEMGYREFFKKYSYTAYQMIHKTDDEIHKENTRDARLLILDLYRRVKAITGEVTSWADVRATQGAQGMAVLNGLVIGKEGRAEIESILAGGYNIQRLHVRVLVHER